MLYRSITIVALSLIAFFSIPSTSAAEAAGHPRLNEQFSLNTVRMLHSAQMTYAAAFGQGNYGLMDHLVSVNLIDPTLGSGKKYGYNFEMTRTHVSTTALGNFIVSATPQVYGKTGRLSYFINAYGEIHGADLGGQPATANDPYIDDCTRGTVAENQRCSLYSLRNLIIAENWYVNTTGNGQFGTLVQLRDRGMISQRLATGIYRGYVFSITITPASGDVPARFHINATPQAYSSTGVISYYTDGTGVIRGADRQGSPADQNDPPV